MEFESLLMNKCFRSPSGAKPKKEKRYNKKKKGATLIFFEGNLPLMLYSLLFRFLLSYDLYVLMDAVVEDIYKRRQPLPTMDAVYFIQPTKEK